jgi:3-phenylpropionate/cinnamic acid dioxygenase small subunit
MSKLDPRLQALIDKDEIREVIYRFARAMDRHDWDLARACYHEGAIDDHGVFRGDKDDYVEWVSENLPRLAETTMHFVGNVMIELDGDAARCEAYVVGYHRYKRDDGTRADFLGGGRYVDRFERRSGEWRIAHRVLVWEWARDEPVGREWEGFGIDPTTFTFGQHGLADLSYTHGRE